ncbi:MAG: MFS transporter [Propionibacteriaceae bacterium]
MTLTPARRWCALLALALGGFAIGTTEFVAMGLLPNIAQDLLPEVYAQSREDGVAKAGWLISAYALGVVVGAPLFAVLARNMSRTRVLLGLVAIFVVGTVASAVLPSFGLVLLSRFVAALPHGAYFGTASLVAASIMGPGSQGKGIAFVMSGLTISNVIGVPAVTWLGQLTDWRVAYLAVAGIFALTLVAVLLAVPSQPRSRGGSVKDELSIFRLPQAWLTMGAAAIGFGGFFAVYSYIAEVVTQVTRLSDSVVPWVLASIGVGMTVGNLVGGHLADRNQRVTLLVGMPVLIATLAGLALVAHTPIGLFVMAFAIGASNAVLIPSLQSRLIRIGGDAQLIAAALNHSAFNVGNSLGAFLGGAAIAAGFGYVAPTVVGVALATIGFGLILLSFALERRPRMRVEAQLVSASDAERQKEPALS